MLGPIWGAAATILSVVAMPDSVPLYQNLGSHHREITTASPRAQAYFDQGLRLSYAFNHAEAIRSFRYATEIDPDCAMCFWGIAYASGPNINAAMPEEAGEVALSATARAVGLIETVTPVERGLIEALEQRYSAANPVDRAALDSAYATAMIALADRFPDDDDVRTLAAESRMLLRPWDYWTAEGEPHPGTAELLADLNAVVERTPDHAGACHFYIHAVEAAHPTRAVACAERLADLMPGAGHIVHMPAHVYIRVGRYADAVDANVHAVHADEEFIEDQNPDGLYPTAYYPHNYHFMAFAAMMAGRAERAIASARAVAEKVPDDVAREVYFLESAPAYAHLALVTFGRWDEVLAEPPPPEALPTAAGLAAYAYGIGFAATGRPDEARAQLARLREFAAQRAAGVESPASGILPIAVHALQAEIALRTGDAEGAMAHFEAAAELEDAMQYDEPPLWYYPIRQSLGRAQLEAGQPEAAEATYRADLARFPDNGWSLTGLAQALEAQGKDAEADEVRQRLAEVWETATVELTASRF